MSDNPMDVTNNSYADWPLHHLVFVKVRDGGGPGAIAHSVAQVHGISVDELKTLCRKTGNEWIARDGALDPINQAVYTWAQE